MSNNYAFKAAKRDGAGKGIARALRRDGHTPAVIYGDNKDPLTISIPTNDINVTFYKGGMFTRVCEMDVEGETHLVLARDVQRHPVSDVVIHADFLRVTKKTKIAVDVPVNLINEELSPGMRDGGVLSVVRFKIELNCSAMEIPESIDVNLEGKEIGDTIKISDAALPEGVTPVINDRDFAIANISAPKTAEQEAAEDEAAEASLAESEAGDDAAEGGDAPADGEEAKEEGGE